MYYTIAIEKLLLHIFRTIAIAKSTNCHETIAIDIAKGLSELLLRHYPEPLLLLLLTTFTIAHV